MTRDQALDNEDFGNTWAAVQSRSTLKGEQGLSQSHVS